MKKAEKTLKEKKKRSQKRRIKIKIRKKKESRSGYENSCSKKARPLAKLKYN